MDTFCCSDCYEWNESFKLQDGLLHLVWDYNVMLMLFIFVFYGFIQSLWLQVVHFVCNVVTTSQHNYLGSMLLCTTNKNQLMKKISLFCSN
jgi:hypothetical protein